MSIFTPSNDTIITMCRTLLEASDINFVDLSFAVKETKQGKLIIVTYHSESGESSVYERVSVHNVLAAYIGLSLPFDLAKNDAVTTGHRLGNTK